MSVKSRHTITITWFHAAEEVNAQFHSVANAMA